MDAGGILRGNWLRGGLPVGALALLLALAVGGCGSSSSAGTTEAGKEKPAAAETEPPESGTAVSTGIPGKVGRVVVSQVGFTLYAFSKDKRNSGTTACYGHCANLWIPYLTRAKPTVIQKARASELGTLKRADGTTQVTYGGWPLYTYKPDPAGTAGGAGRKSFGGVWYPIDPSGELVH